MNLREPQPVNARKLRFEEFLPDTEQMELGTRSTTKEAERDTERDAKRDAEKFAAAFRHKLEELEHT